MQILQHPAPQGQLCIMLQEIVGHIQLVKLLLSKGVDVDLQSDAGIPLMWAAGLGQEDAVKFDSQTGDQLWQPIHFLRGAVSKGRG